jgi:excisionase family DNA binding protein
MSALGSRQPPPPLLDPGPPATERVVAIRRERDAAPAGPEVPPDLRLLDVRQTARVLGSSKSKVYEWIRGGRLRTVRLDGLTKIRRSDLEAFIDSLE